MKENFENNYNDEEILEKITIKKKEPKKGGKRSARIDNTKKDKRKSKSKDSKGKTGTIKNGVSSAFRPSGSAVLAMRFISTRGRARVSCRLWVSSPQLCAVQEDQSAAAAYPQRNQ